jgi:hypothetical protein
MDFAVSRSLSILSISRRWRWPRRPIQVLSQQAHGAAADDAVPFLVRDVCEQKGSRLLVLGAVKAGLAMIQTVEKAALKR